MIRDRSFPSAACSESASRIGSSTSSTKRLRPGQPADRRDRRAPVRDAERGEPSRRGEHLVEVEHRLAHPHEDRVVDGLDAAEVQRLVEDLRRREVPPERHLARRAERARQRAARLRRQAERAAAVAVAHQHRLDRMAVGRAEERLHVPSRDSRSVSTVERRERHVRLELLAQARAAGSSSRRSRSRRAPSTPTPAVRGRAARRARVSVDSRSVRSTGLR